MNDDLFPRGSYKDIRLQDKIDELKREIKLRQRVYPRWVDMGKLDGVLADKRILALQAVLRDYQAPRLKMLEELLEEWAEAVNWPKYDAVTHDLDGRTRKALGLPEQ